MTSDQNTEGTATQSAGANDQAATDAATKKTERKRRRVARKSTMTPDLCKRHGLAPSVYGFGPDAKKAKR